MKISFYVCQESTEFDFWRLVWEHRVVTVVVLSVVHHPSHHHHHNQDSTSVNSASNTPGMC